MLLNERNQGTTLLRCRKWPAKEIADGVYEHAAARARKRIPLQQVPVQTAKNRDRCVVGPNGKAAYRQTRFSFRWFQVKVWFQNRRMKHKRQTLSKEDADEKDGSTSDGMEKSKGEKMLAIDSDEKKSCHNCDISSVNDVGSTLSGDVTELSSSGRRSSNNNNNTPTATNNNNNNSNPAFNANSNGASSVGSTNSVSSSFEKMIADDDSRSQDGSEVTSPSVAGKKLSSDVRVKVESGHKSPNPGKQQISVSKKSPSASTKELCSVNSNGVLLAMPDSTVSTPVLPGQNSTRSLTPSSTPGTPVSVQLQQGSPLGIQATHAAYMQRPRSSPSSTSSVAAPMMHGSTNAGTMSPHGGRNISNNQQTHFQQQSVYQSTSAIDYRNGVPNRQAVPAASQQTQSQGNYCSRDTYQQPRISYPGDVHPLYARQNQVLGSRVGHHVRAATGGASRTMYNSSMQFHQQQNQYANTGGEYNGYPQAGPYHASYHRTIQGGSGYNTSQGYSAQHDQTTENYMTPTGNYGYPSGGNYHATSENLASGDYRAGAKCHPNAYYDQQTSQLHVHQGGEASSIPNSYVSSPDPFPAPGMTTTATAIAAATAAVITPPGSAAQAEGNADSYNYGNFYAEPVHTTAPPPSADNSNSSSDFNFLTNLANDFAPEYYQLS
ncbi:unnamed protein product [Heterotrigona itama]|uniref:Homeobox domain-containing protein n=1 Tax=Heterotrigona itama TaxID=395501 RepID=A0A6V7GXM1_9HYME|nr:unnamed protein product [Heterotrigona itama]